MVALDILATLLFSAFAAKASDGWDFCSNADGSVKMESETLIIDGIGETSYTSLKTIKLLDSQEEKCILKRSGTGVVSYSNETTAKEVKYTTEENDSQTTVFLICETGGSGIPANDSCRD